MQQQLEFDWVLHISSRWCKHHRATKLLVKPLRSIRHAYAYTNHVKGVYVQSVANRQYNPIAGVNAKSNRDRDGFRFARVERISDFVVESERQRLSDDIGESSPHAERISNRKHVSHRVTTAHFEFLAKSDRYFWAYTHPHTVSIALREPVPHGFANSVHVRFTLVQYVVEFVVISFN